MSEENNLDPCGDARPQGRGTGEPVTPEPEGFEFDPPIYPEIETEFPDVPSARECIIVPRHLYYNHQEFDVDYFRRRTERESRRPINTVNSPLPTAQQDPVRFILGKVYDFSKYRNKNYFVHDNLDINEEEKVDFKVDDTLINQTNDGPNTITSMYLRSTRRTAETLFPSEEHPLPFARSGLPPDEMGYPTVVQFYKDLYKTQGTLYVDDSFKAPAAFFAKEADGLNIVLPELASAQTFIPDMMTFSDNRADYENFYEFGGRDPRLTKSVYERYSEEFNQRYSGCPEGEFVKVQKFPAQQVQELNQISNYAIPSRGNTEFSSFQRIFRREYNFYNKISFNTDHELSLIHI